MSKSFCYYHKPAIKFYCLKMILLHPTANVSHLKLCRNKQMFSEQQRKYASCNSQKSIRKIFPCFKNFFSSVENNLMRQTKSYTEILSNIKVMFSSLFLTFTKADKYSFCFENVQERHTDFHQSLLYFNIKNSYQDKMFSKQIEDQKEKTMPKDELEEQWNGAEAFKLIIFIQEDFDSVLNKHPLILVFFSADWCQHCQKLRKPYGKAALMAKKANIPIVFATFDVTTNPDVADEKGVVGIPTLKYYKNGKFVSNFKGKRTAEDIFEFVKNPPSPPAEPKKKTDV